MIEIPWQKIPKDTLRLMLQEIVTRDGTDYGAIEKSEDVRLEEAIMNLQKGRAVLVWNEEIESASLVERQRLSD